MTNLPIKLEDYKKDHPGFARWAEGVGVIQHKSDTQSQLISFIDESGLSYESILALFKAADRLCSQAMWLVVHMSYAKNLYLDGAPLKAEDFKRNPQGHTGGALNMVPAYVGYLLANALTGESREWIMGQGHCVAAVDAVNLLIGNSLPEHETRYTLTDEGLSLLLKDFYAYRITADGLPESPVGSHANIHTAGATMEGGYLGFAGLHYVHQPVPGEKLVAFLSDGAFEEQRGSDWSARWWRASDSGLVAPIMIANGRRIDQRTTSQQLGGVDYFVKHLRAHSFEPFVFDGRDPAAFALSIIRQETQLIEAGRKAEAGELAYPVKLPYGIAETEKGYGFYGQATNAAHGTPLPGNPKSDSASREIFNAACARLFVPEQDWRAAAYVLSNHKQSGRLKERDTLAQLTPVTAHIPEITLPDEQTPRSSTAALDLAFVEIVQANPQLRPRVGNPDELRSNRFDKTLDLLKHRVTEPEAGVAEAVDGKVITALNEEAIISAALANRRGINIAISYEAFAPKMLGAVRQKLIFSRHAKEAGRPSSWLSVPVIATSHLWENGKNEQSHQDSVYCEAMLSEMSDISRVCFPADAQSAVETLRECYSTHGLIFTLVVAKEKLADQLDSAQAKQLARIGACRLSGTGDEAVQIMAIGAYQLVEARKACQRLTEKNHPHSLVYIAEPGRFRSPRDPWEAEFVNQWSAMEEVQSLFGKPQYRLLLVHGRPEVFQGVLRPLDLGSKYMTTLGYINRGGTLDTPAMLFANRTTWAHALARLAELDAAYQGCLNDAEALAVQGKGNPYSVIREPYRD